MKVLHVVECFAAGTAHFINLATQYMHDVEHTVVHGERKGEISADEVKAKFPPYVNFIKWKSVQREISLINDFKALLELRAIISENCPDVIHLHSSKAGFIGRVVSFTLGYKNVIYTPHGAAFLRKDINFLKVKFYTILEFIANKLSGKIICCSKSEAQAFNSANIKSTYISNGTTIIENCSAKREMSMDRLCVVTCGRMTEQKNPLLFNEIASAFRGNSKVSFVWIGDGELREELSSENIQVTGWIPKSEVANILINADLYLSTSLWEGLPFSVLEAMSLGKGLLLTDCVGNKDLVSEGVNGFTFCEPTKAVKIITDMINDPNKLVELGEMSKSKCSDEFNVEKTFMEYRLAYNSLSTTKVGLWKSKQTV